jgi:isoleucyl-tRNA synthetase
VLKDRLYISAPQIAWTTLGADCVWHIGEALVRLLAPIMSFTCEESGNTCRRSKDAKRACIWRLPFGRRDRAGKDRESGVEVQVPHDDWNDAALFATKC